MKTSRKLSAFSHQILIRSIIRRLDSIKNLTEINDFLFFDR
ncbi:hypothetical protein PMAG_b0109 [Pseudoalteromonas mariniglutinosa NCIMB 1770]|nr:hypothetical protein [Pseudoalteromonas mariniglutinosa NCIMB 1770]